MKLALGTVDFPEPDYTESMWGDYTNGGFGGGYGSGAISSSSSGPSFGQDLANIFAGIASSAGKIAAARYSVPQLNPGQSITTTPVGSQLTQQPAGYPASGASSSLGLSAGLGGSMPLILAAVAVVFLVSKK